MTDNDPKNHADTAPQVIKGNMQQAAEQADYLLDHTFDAIRPPVKWTHAQTSAGPCTDWKNQATDKGVVTRRRTVLTIISEERRGNFLGVVERHWRKNDYTMLSVNKSKKIPAIHMRTPDGFSISLEFGYKGQAFFKVSTPCADESEVSRPKTEPPAPDYYDRKAPLPNVEDAFWSAHKGS